MAVDAEEAGMDAFMDKPFKLEELIAVYTKILVRDNQNQRVVSASQTAASSGVDVDSLGAIVRGPRSVCNVTKNAKIFIDASELNDMFASQMAVDKCSLEQDGTLPTIAVVVSESEWKGKLETGPAQLPTGSGIGSDMISEIKLNSAKVHAAN